MPADNAIGGETTKTLFPTPLLDTYQSTQAPKGQVSFYGHHASFCNRDQADGCSVTEHGPVCEGQVGPGIDFWEPEGQHDWLYVQQVSLYVHGVYEQASNPCSPRIAHDPSMMIQLITSTEMDDGIDHGAVRGRFMSPSAARSLAASLVAAADRAEQLR